MRTCPCSSIDSLSHDDPVASFARLRDRCPAISKILVPDEIWPNYEKWCFEETDDACHRPMAYLAFTRKYMANLTDPIHRFCLDGGNVHPSLRSQYKNDLAEKWMLKDDVKSRFDTFRIFEGRAWELLFADCLYREGWRIEGLEAHGAGSDVVAMSPSAELCAFEVKHIGEHKDAFRMNVDALASNKPIYARFSAYAPINNMFLRIFDAAKQLQGAEGRKVAVVILTEYQRSFEIPLRKAWCKWRDPAFVRRDDETERLLKEACEKYPNLEAEMKRLIPQIDEIWFYEKEHGLTMRRCPKEKVRG